MKVTIDNEWDEEELRSDVYDVCTHIMTPELLEKYKHRALKDKDLLLPQYMTEQILNKIGDVVELYDECYKYHGGDRDVIECYDEEVAEMIYKELKENLVC